MKGKEANLWLRFTALFLLTVLPLRAQDTLLNVSYDPTRELYEEINKHFAESWKEKHAKTITIQQSHGGSGKQARSVIDGLEADVLTLALAYDIDQVSKHAKLLPPTWQQEFPHNSCPYTSTVVFLVRQGNPKGIKDWADLIRPDIKVITPNPKTSGGARWNYMAAYGYALQSYNKNEDKAYEFMKALFKNVPVLDTGARGSTTTFVQRGIGDVLITWENEALLAMRELGPGKVEIVNPSISILAEPPVAVVAKNTAKRGTTDLAKAYLNFLYTEKGQEIIAKHYFRARNPLAASSGKFPEIKMMTIAEFEGWEAVQKKHFDEGGLFDKLSLGAQ